MRNKSPMLSQYMKDSKIVAVDYDGTLTIDGNTLCDGAKKYIPKIAKLGVNLVLWTCRCDERYTEASQKIREWGLPIQFGIPSNKPRKLCAIFTIDDRSVPGGKINWRKTYKYIKKELKECN